MDHLEFSWETKYVRRQEQKSSLFTCIEDTKVETSHHIYDHKLASNTDLRWYHIHNALNTWFQDTDCHPLPCICASEPWPWFWHIHEFKSDGQLWVSCWHPGCGLHSLSWTEVDLLDSQPRDGRFYACLCFSCRFVSLFNLWCVVNEHLLLCIILYQIIVSILQHGWRSPWSGDASPPSPCRGQSKWPTRYFRPWWGSAEWRWPVLPGWLSPSWLPSSYIL